MQTHMYQIFIFFGTFSLAVLAGHFYAWRRLVYDTKLPAVWRRRFNYVILTLLGMVLLGHALRRQITPVVTRPALTLPYVWLIVVMLLDSFILPCDGVRILWWILGRIRPRLRLDPAQRVFWSRSVATVALLVVLVQTSVGIYRGGQPPVVKTVDITLSKLPRSMEGFTIAQISDLHIGLTLGGKWAADVVTLVQEQRPDLIVLTGDTVDRDPRSMADDAAALAALSAPFGVYYVTGNHEYYSDYEAWRPIFTRMGLRALHNEWTFISRNGQEGFALIGMDDQAKFGGFGMSRAEMIPLDNAMHGLDPAWETVLLIHRPETVTEAARLGIGLQLSGHTHGGQIWPFGYLVQIGQVFVRGYHTYGERTQIYVSQGAGYWGPPVRLASKNEIILFRLHAS